MLRKLALVMVLALALPVLARATEEVDVYRAEGCDCCGKWAEHMQQSGFKVRLHNLSSRQLSQLKTGAGIADQHASCHTAKVDGYVIEGHVPAADVRRLLKERPQAVGLSVPGMPVGSPGMEVGDTRDPYDVLLLKQDGTAETYARH